VRWVANGCIFSFDDRVLIWPDSEWESTVAAFHRGDAPTLVEQLTDYHLAKIDEMCVRVLRDRLRRLRLTTASD